MIDNYFLSVEVFTHHRDGNVFPPLRGVERPLWQGRAGIAEYAFDEPASQPRWALPETTELMVTDHRVLYAHTRSDSPDTREVVSGELRWIWPQHLRVQPGAVQSGRSAATTQVQLVCAGADGTWPALVFAGGDLQTVGDADKLANLIRQAIARFRLDNAAKLGLSTSQGRLLSRLVIGPEFTNYQGGPGQTVSVLGALPVQAPAAEAEPTPPAASDPAPATSGPAPMAAAPGSTPMSAGPIAAPMAAAPVTSPMAAAPIAAPMAAAPVTAPMAAAPVPAPMAAAPVTAPMAAAPITAPTAAAPIAAEPRTNGKGTHRTPEDSPTVDLRAAARAVGEGPTRVISVRPGVAADATRARQAAEAEAAAQRAEPELASRAAEIAARVADLVSRPAPQTPSTSPKTPSASPQTPSAPPQTPSAPPQTPSASPRHAKETTDEPGYSEDGPTRRLDLSAPGRAEETTNLTDRAEALRRSTARMAANSGRHKAAARRAVTIWSDAYSDGIR